MSESVRGAITTALAIAVVGIATFMSFCVMGALDLHSLRMQVEELKDQNAGLLHQLNETDARLDLCLNEGEVDE